MNEVSESTGTLDVALDHTARLLEVDPALAAEQALEILNAVPNHPKAILLLVAAHRRAGNPGAALEVLDPLMPQQARWADGHFEYGLALAAAGRGDESIQALQTLVALQPNHLEAWRVLADHLMATGDSEGGDAAYARHIECSTLDPTLRQAAAAMVKNDIPQAEAVLKSHLKKAPTDVPAIRMLAEVAVRCGRNEDAEKLLVRCLELAPSFTPARFNYATLLHRLNKSSAALLQIESLLAENPRNPGYRNLTAVILSRIGEYQRSSQMYAELLAEYPANAKIWLSYGHVLKTEGRQEECVAAYRRTLEKDPDFGEAYWSLANLKTFRFTAADLTAMRAKLADKRLDDKNRLHIHFALGKAAEDMGEYAQSFEHYDQGNALHRAANPYNADGNSARTQRLKKNFTADFFSARCGWGCETQAPIFVVGMPRSGSTLLEQILASHSAVEGTTELPEIITLALELRGQAQEGDIAAYSNVLASKSAAELQELGQQYIERTRIHRRTDSPFFIDKMPNNFLHIGMIHAILPNARIIDARRHPLGCCFSNFKQYYARGQGFSYGLEDVGRFYHDYVELMAHYDEVLPGRIHRVFYEDMVEETETEVRKLLDHCGLPFEDSCLRFFENQRPVRTASSEQVRQPIYREGVEQWRHYEAWLDPLKRALGEVLDSYPAVPRF